MHNEIRTTVRAQGDTFGWRRPGYGQVEWPELEPDTLNTSMFALFVHGSS